MYCRECGCELANDARFCKRCGTAVSGVPQETQQRPASAANPAPAARNTPAAGSAPAAAANPAPAVSPVPATGPVPAAKPGPAAKAAPVGRADKIDGKLIVAVAVFLTLQLVAVWKVVSAVDTGPEARTEAALAVGGAEENVQDGSGSEIYVGGKVEFGVYEQDGNTQNGMEPIVWDVVDSFEDGYLLVSRYILDAVPWDDGSGDGSALELKTEITYEQCSMRRWIRDSFAEMAFTEEERSRIIPVSVKGDDILAKKDNQYATDYAFILREDEVKDYWGYAAPDAANALLACAPTDYAVFSGLTTSTGTGKARHSYGDSFATAQWALRRRYTDPKAKEAKIVTVDTAGRFSNSVVTELLGFRPAIYIVYN